MMPDRLEPEIDDGLGIWRPRTIVIDAMTNLHRYLEDGYCVLVPVGNYTGGGGSLSSGHIYPYP